MVCGDYPREICVGKALLFAKTGGLGSGTGKGPGLGGGQDNDISLTPTHDPNP